jgi:hypothetical protein
MIEKIGAKVKVGAKTKERAKAKVTTNRSEAKG